MLCIFKVTELLFKPFVCSWLDVIIKVKSGKISRFLLFFYKCNLLLVLLQRTEKRADATRVTSVLDIKLHPSGSDVFGGHLMEKKIGPKPCNYLLIFFFNRQLCFVELI